MLIKLKLNNLTCADCAGKIEDYIKSKENVEKVNLNFSIKTLSFETKTNFEETNLIVKDLSKFILNLEPDVVIENLTYSNFELKLEGLTCADCAKTIDEKIKKEDGVLGTNLNFATSNYNIFYLKKSNLNIDKLTHIINSIEEDVNVLDLKGDIQDLKSKDRNKKQFLRIGISAVLFGLSYIFKDYSFLFLLSSYLIVGVDVVVSAVKNLFRGNPLDEKFLMTIATLAAFYIGEYPEAVMVMLLYQVGETLQAIAVDNSRESISSLINIRPDYANLIIDDKNNTMEVDPSKVMVNDYILIKPGEKIPLDGLVVEGDSYIDTSNITGESVPVKVKKDKEVISGSINQNGVLKVKVLKIFEDSTVSTILNLLENSSSNKAKVENIVDKVAKIYTPVVTLIAVLLVFIPFIFKIGNINDWIYKAAVFLVMSCPCALVISIPLSYFGGLGASSKKGILVKGDNHLESLGMVDAILFDKTGTITKGVFDVSKIYSYNKVSQADVLEVAAYAEHYSSHPIAKSIKSKYNKEINESIINNYEDIPGHGIKLNINNEEVLVGNKRLLNKYKIDLKENIDEIGTIVYVVKNKEHIGTIVVSDIIKDNIKEDIKNLKNLGIKEIVMLSGDNKEIAEAIGKKVGLDSYYGDLLPQDKVDILEDYKKKYNTVAFVGDGVNDAPALKLSNVGISMGSIGSDAAIEASDVVVMSDDISKIAEAIDVSKFTQKIVKQNLIIVAVIKLAVLTLGLLGISTMWQAVFADVGVSIIAIFNSIRILRR